MIGISLSTIAVFLTFNWFLNTLMPLNRLNSLQPTQAHTLLSNPLNVALLECNMSQNWQANNSGLLLDCDTSEIQVQQPPSHIKNIASKVVAPGQKKAIAISDPIVVVGKMAPGKDSNVITAELLAYGNRGTNLSTFQANGVLQIIGAEVTGLLGVLLLFIDWRISRKRRARKTADAWQAEKTYPSSKQHLFEIPVYQPKR
jgi:hypothetical protein